MDIKKQFQKHFFLTDREKYTYAKWFKNKGATYEQFHVLLDISEQENGKEIGLVADALTIPRQTMTHLVDALEDKKWLTRNKAPNDRRKVHIVITELGKEVLDSIDNELWLLEKSAIASISEQEFEVFNDVFERLIHGLEQALSNDIEAE